ncbi:ATP12 chaperone protein, putative [Bodo saltans]|uniref:ATP12 chaperone protein, putative n=1 Tax=Bodo saltans TaxID=75058 RepID=B6DTF4_BODSA|nr:hypothetical protein [Bodo saltans]CUG88459.1 ATP12 chaperone protein, putative [Bodo saltans]|eukprot:CUG88459.1 ATP12 chaperone protein, putative [Bodo saltans]
MRRLTSSTGALLSSLAAATCMSARVCSSSSSVGAAPKKPKRRLSPQLDASELLKSIPLEPEAKAELSTAELERKVDEWSKLTPEELDALYKQYEAEESAESRVLQEDSLYQMDVSLKTRASGAVRVFWTDVAVVPFDEQKYPGWFAVAVDGRKVKAFESQRVLALPNEELALACAREYAAQKGHINKLLMPITDLCSGAMQVAPQAIQPRIDYLMTFYQNDNCYFRAAAIAAKQDEMITPITNWFSRVFDVDVPRVLGIGHPGITPQSVEKVREALIALNMNPYQVVAMCVVAQFTSSIMLPLALFNRVVDLPTAFAINRAEEGHNIATAGMIEGYHDIREADSVVKICASATAWQLTHNISMAKCAELPRSFALEEMETPY